MSLQPEKDEHGCIKGRERWNGTRCVAIESEKVKEQTQKTQAATEPDQKTPETQIQGTPQSTTTGPRVRDIHAEREKHRIKIDTGIATRQFREPTVATHAVDRTYANKPLSTARGQDVSRASRQGIIDLIKGKRKEKTVKKES